MSLSVCVCVCVSHLGRVLMKVTRLSWLTSGLGGVMTSTSALCLFRPANEASRWEGTRVSRPSDWLVERPSLRVLGPRWRPAVWLRLGREERGGSRRGGAACCLERSSLAWKLPTAYRPCTHTHTHTLATQSAALSL